MLRAIFALLLLTLTPSAPASAETAAGKAMTAWLAAFNSGDPALIRAFDETYQPKRPLAETAGFRAETGGFTLLRIEKEEPTAVTALVQEKSSDTVARMELSLASVDPPRLAGISLQVIPRPPDLAIPRMSEKEALTALTARADELAKADEFSGAVLVARGGKILLEKAWGRADREAGTPVTLDTRFRIGSMNKMFTAVAILQLVEAGKLSLDDTVGKILPDYPNQDVATKVKIRHLLTHTGGTGDIFGPDFVKNRLTLREHGDYLKLYGARGLTHEPGAEQRYSNYGFVLLGAIIEKVTGSSYYDYVRAHVFQPAGMSATDSLTESEKVPHRSRGYMKGDNGWTPNDDTLPWRGTAAGGGYSTVGDLFRFAQALESGKLLSKKMLAEATREQRDGYGFGFGARGEGELRGYGHGGGAPGMNGELKVFPDLGYVLVSLSNFDPPAASRVVSYFELRMPVAK